jgi:hypothetical protein
VQGSAASGGLGRGRGRQLAGPPARVTCASWRRPPRRWRRWRRRRPPAAQPPPRRGASCRPRRPPPPRAAPAPLRQQGGGSRRVREGGPRSPWAYLPSCLPSCLPASAARARRGLPAGGWQGECRQAAALPPTSVRRPVRAVRPAHPQRAALEACTGREGGHPSAQPLGRRLPPLAGTRQHSPARPFCRTQQAAWLAHGAALPGQAGLRTVSHQSAAGRRSWARRQSPARPCCWPLRRRQRAQQVSRQLPPPWQRQPAPPPLQHAGRRQRSPPSARLPGCQAAPAAAAGRPRRSCPAASQGRLGCLGPSRARAAHPCAWPGRRWCPRRCPRWLRRCRSWLGCPRGLRGGGGWG